MAKIAILGCGTVGSGVRELLEQNAAQISVAAGCPVEVKRILDKRDFPDAPAGLFTKDFSDILSDGEITVVAECMGGCEPAYTFTRACLEAGKSVVTSNKELVAEKGDLLLAAARSRNVNFLFEASVGGGIPIIKPLHLCLGANRIDAVSGILNGTTNYILSKMADDGVSFGEALTQAQALGYAEANPSADVDGTDACRKICILASLCFGSHVYPSGISVTGIRGVTREDISAAAEAGGRIKLIASARRNGSDGAELFVAPCIVMPSSPLYSVADVFNGILVEGNAVGLVFFEGRGAGKLPTASAVVSDIIDALRAGGSIPTLGWGPEKPGFVSAPGACAETVNGMRVLR